MKKVQEVVEREEAVEEGDDRSLGGLSNTVVAN